MEVARKLASIRRVRSIEPIEGADNIELARVDGWQCVVKKGEFKPGDMGVYFEIDSFLPVDERFEFLRKGGGLRKMGDREGFRLRTIKLRGQLSQGLILPLSMFPEILADLYLQARPGFDPLEGLDVTELLGVVKYEPPIPAQLAGEVKGLFPSFIPKTDQERIQNLMHYFDEHKDTPFEVSVKLDGSSMTVYYNNGEFGVCSRNLELRDTLGNTFWAVAKKHRLHEIMPNLGLNIAIQGELVGPGIQGNRGKLAQHEMFVFDIYNIDRQEYVGSSERWAILKAFHELGTELSHVPVLNGGHPLMVFEVFPAIEHLLHYADGDPLDDLREGIVCKSIDRQVSFKVISNRYLLKGDDNS